MRIRRMDRPASWIVLALLAAIAAWAWIRVPEPQAPPPPAPVQHGSPAYTHAAASPDGIGKFFHGREIAKVMGHPAIGWLERGERDDIEKIGRILIATKSGMSGSATQSAGGAALGGGMGGGMGAGGVATRTSGSKSGSGSTAAYIPLAMVATITREVGANEIASENGRLRAYVQANVQDRDLGGFVNDVEAALKRQKTELRPGAVITIDHDFFGFYQQRRQAELVEMEAAFKINDGRRIDPQDRAKLDAMAAHQENLKQKIDKLGAELAALRAEIARIESALKS